MTYLDPFSKVVTLTKRNHRYYGPTESNKFRGALTEIATEMGTIFGEADTISDSVDALASGYLEPDGGEYTLYNLKRKLYYFENRLQHYIFVQAKQVTIL